MKTPKFIVVGAHKAATTSINYYLEQHPEIYLIPNKGEDALARCGINSLEDISEYLQKYNQVSNEITWGEVSSVYLHGRGVAQQIQNLFPEVKIITILRNPAERAYSHAFHGQAYTRKELKNISSIILESKKILRPGYYYSHLKTYFQLFPQEQIKIMLYDDLVNRPDYFFAELFTFLGVNNSFQPSLQKRLHKGSVNVNEVTSNSLKYFRSHDNSLKTVTKFLLNPILPQVKQLIEKKTHLPLPPLSSELRKSLLAIYRDDIVKLQELTNFDYSHWLHS